MKNIFAISIYTLLVVLGDLVFFWIGIMIIYQSIQDFLKLKNISKESTQIDWNRLGKPVKFLGKMISNSVLKKPPLGEKDCIYFETVIEKYIVRKSSGDWRIQSTTIDSVPFVLEKNGIEIRPEFEKDENPFLGYSLEFSTEMENIEGNIEKIWKREKLTESHRIMYYALYQNEKVFVSGVLGEREDGEGLKIFGNKKTPLLIFKGDEEEYRSFMWEDIRNSALLGLGSLIFSILAFIFVIVPDLEKLL
ncbi:MAG: hypothetical protein H7A24_06810 [Leptospiraceae bacterium]|nr:hypothetical protein [Leptospiraceae bacterium]MCP5511573.1 hypothetical protein [Leptospiraceae bacterium]